MNKLKWWMRIVGAFYLFLAVMDLPPMRAQGFFNAFPGLAQVQETLAFRLLLEAWLMFGLETGILGLMLIWASRSPEQSLVLVYTVVALELVRGILMDVYTIVVSGAPAEFYIAFAAIHAVIIITGLAFLPKGAGQGQRASAAQLS